jgi:hypothetical protein
MPKPIREAGLAKLRSRPEPNTDYAMLSPPILPQANLPFTRVRKESHESLAFAPPFTNGAAEITHFPPAGPSRTYTVRKTSSSNSASGLRAQPSPSPSASVGVGVGASGTIEDPIHIRGGGTIGIGIGSKRHIMEDGEYDDEIIDGDGWVRKRLNKVMSKVSRSATSGQAGSSREAPKIQGLWELPGALEYFRVSPSSLG